jgi:hypothetical protein
MSLVNELIKGLLPENEQREVAVYGGGFKPPTRGHFEVVKTALNKNPNIDKFIVLIGGKERDGISPDESLLIWDIYKKYLPISVEIQLSPKPPIQAVYNYAKNNPEELVLFVIGAREGNEEDFKDIASRTTSLDKYPNMRLETVITKGGVSGTAARNAAKISLEKFKPFVPSELSDEEVEEVYNIVSNKVQEILTENASYSENINLKREIAKLTKHMIDKGMNIQPLPKLVFKNGDSENAKQFLGKTAYYDPNSQSIVLYTEGRHPKDIVRSFSHEMVHHTQFLEDRLGEVSTTNTMEDDNIDKLEQEANLKGTMTFRNWTDSLNEGKQVSTIYHYTTFEAGLKILQSNQFRSGEAADSTNAKPVFAVSFTRDKRFHDSHVVGFDESSFGNKPQLRFTIDGNKLSNRFSVQPHSQGGAFSKNRKGFEAEERVVSNKPFTIPLSDYLMSVDVLLEYKKTSNEYDILSIVDYEMYAPLRAKIIKFAQDKNLPINLIVNKNGDPWPDKVKNTLIQKILDWFTMKEANLKGTMTFRNWTDSLNEGILAENEELDNLSLYSPEEIRSMDLPKEGGIYFWWVNSEAAAVIDNLSPNTQMGMCQKRDIKGEEYSLVYVGLAKNLSSRVKDWHIKQKHSDSAVRSGFISTLRQTIAALLGKNLYAQEAINDFQNKYMLVGFIETEDYKVEELKFIGSCSLPLNIRDNKTHPFYKELKALRKISKQNSLDEGIDDQLKQYIDGDVDVVDVDLLKNLLKFKSKNPEDLDPRTGGNNYGYRGMTFDKDFIKTLNVKNKSNGTTEYEVPSNTKITSKNDRGFLSFSTDEEVAKGFGHYSGYVDHKKSPDKVGGYVKVSLDNPNFIIHPDYMGELSKDMEYSKESEKETLYVGDSFAPKSIFVVDKDLYKLKEDKKKDPFGLNAYARELAMGLEENKVMDYKIYVDMDGVVADFDQRFKDLSGIGPREFEEKYGKDAFWDFIDEGENKLKFWVGIPQMSDAKQLIDFVSNYDYEMLTAPSIKKQSLMGKGLWMINQTKNGLFPSKPKVNYKSAKNKKDFAAPNHILIDDREDTINSWNASGGIGILHTSASNTISQLKKLGL